MTYRWTPEGPVFEFPTPYGTENKLLGARGYALIACAIGLALVLLFIDSGQADRPAFTLGKLPEKASLVPHVLAAAWLALLGLLDLLQVKRQRVLQLLPGQPASLMFEVAHEGSGASSGAAGLLGLLEGKTAAAPPLQGAYAGLLGRLVGTLAAAPTTLYAYLNLRLSNLLLWSGLLLILALESLLLPQPAAAPLVALLLGGLAAAVGTRQVLVPERSAWAPWLAAVLLLAMLLLSAGVGWFANLAPGAEHFKRLGLPLAAALLFAGALLVDLLGILAARAQWAAVDVSHTAAHEVGLGADLAVDPDAMLRELDLEFHRRWTEGVPNRRYARQTTAAAEAHGTFATLLLEESQPMAMAPPRGQAAAIAPGAPTRAGQLALSAFGLLCSLAGGLLWIGLAWVQMKDASASWAAGSAGLSCLLLGAYAMRHAHLLWSRVEVHSTITWLEFSGAYASSGSGADADASATGPRALKVVNMRLRVRAVRARSVFFAAANYSVGSRVLLGLQPQATEAGTWIAFLQTWAGQAATSVSTRPAAPGPTDRARDSRRPEPESPGPMTRPPRFCPACGTPLLQGARFCQQCGQGLANP